MRYAAFAATWIGAILLSASGPPASAQTASQPLPPEITRIRAEIVAECGGRATFQPGFMRSADFNGDGRPDYVLDHGAVACVPAKTNPECGSGGCTVQIFVSEAGGYRNGFTDTVRALSIQQRNGRAVIALDLHGSACGRVGAATCKQQMAWNGRAFARAGSPTR